MNYITYIISVLGFGYMVYLLWETPHVSISGLSLEKDGIIQLNDVNSKEDVLQLLPPNYTFIPYRYHIKGPGVSTFHRDVTSSPYEYKSKYPVYTLI